MAAAKKPSPSKKPRYDQHPMFSMQASTIRGLEEESGRKWESWVALAKKRGAKTAKELETWLKDEHGLTPRRASWVAWAATTGEDARHQDDPDCLVDALYSGTKVKLRPVHEKVVDAARGLGGEVIVTACKTMVPIYRKHVFAELRPVEDSVEVHLALGNVAAKGRLEKSRTRMPGDRLTHRVLVKSARDVDAELKGWLAKAYEHGAGKMARAADAKVPPDLVKALEASAKASATWKDCTPAMQRDFVDWIVSAKQAETRSRRVLQTIDKLTAGKKRMY